MSTFRVDQTALSQWTLRADKLKLKQSAIKLSNAQALLVKMYTLVFTLKAVLSFLGELSAVFNKGRGGILGDLNCQKYAYE
ncbi:MAG: hypothetical protein H8E15_15110 [Planctomycetes bacterium]|nr:hypothetical protein [Planctomycetota bacterium]